MSEDHDAAIEAEQHEEVGPQCVCPPVADLLRSALEERTAPPCDVHPRVGDPGDPSRLPLNSADLARRIKADLRDGEAVPDLAEQLRSALIAADEPTPRAKPKPRRFPPTHKAPPEDRTGHSFAILRR